MSRNYQTNMNENPSFSDLVGKTLKEVRVDRGNHNDRIDFVCESGEVYRLYHSQDCCESVCIEDLCGEIADLVGSQIVQAEENSNDENVQFEGRPEVDEYGGSFTWTFYRIATSKGQVVIRWLGESNGYYSESVDFCKL